MIYLVEFQNTLDAVERQHFLTELTQQLGRPVSAIYHYNVAYQGMAIELTAAEAIIVAQMNPVKRVQADKPRYMSSRSSSFVEVE